MRFVAAISGIIVSVPPLIFFWVGAQTFTRLAERGLAVAMVIGAGALLGTSVALLFTPSVQRPQAMLLAAMVVAVIVILIWHYLMR